MRKCAWNKPCVEAMEMSFVAWPKKAGLNVTDLINVKTGAKSKGQHYRFPKGHDYFGKIVYLKFCPWCGSDLRKRSREAEKARKEELKKLSKRI